MLPINSRVYNSLKVRLLTSSFRYSVVFFFQFGLKSDFLNTGGFKKCFWLLVMMGMVSALMYNIVQLTIKYFDYPVNVKLNLNHQHQMTFPSVTVCNMSPVKKSSLEAAQKSTADSAKDRKKRSSMLETLLSQHINVIAPHNGCVHIQTGNNSKSN